MIEGRFMVSGYGGGDVTSIALMQLKDHAIEILWKDNIPAPSFLSGHGDLLFAASEQADNCMLTMYRQTEDHLELLDSKVLAISGVCHIEYLPKSSILLGSSYDEGIVFSVEVKDNKFGGLIDRVLQPANSAGISRVHCSLTRSDEAAVYVTNIATDTVYKYRLTVGKFQVQDKFKLKEGSGPRHMVFGQEEARLYVNTEYSNETYCLSLEDGRMQLLQVVGNSPSARHEVDTASSICMSHDGRHLYVATRGLNIITLFEVDHEGKLKNPGYYSCQGNWPRHISLMRDDQLLVIANQFSHRVVLLERNTDTGLLKETGVSFDFAEPSFVQEYQS